MLISSQLRCEYAINPLGVDSPRPRLMWSLQHPQRGQNQTAYQILAASSIQALENELADHWDSGKVTTPGWAIADYAGKPLESRQRCFWKVRTWDSQDRPGPYSEPAWFEMGLLHPQDWQAEWIGFPAGRNGKAIYLRKVFNLEKKIQRGRVYISGLGYYELRLNGEKVGNHVLDPGTTDYSKRIFYVTYDVGDLLQTGPNALGVILGNGWYGIPKLLMQLEVEFTDGTRAIVVSGMKGDWEPWQVASGPIQENSIYDGEVYDARLERPSWDMPEGEVFSQGGGASDRLRAWTMASVIDGPGGKLVAQTAEPIRVVNTLMPQKLSQPNPNIFVYDMGQNFAGWARLHVQGECGHRVTLRYGETLYENGCVNQENLRTAEATDVYILKGTGQEVWEPRFTYHGFRYVQVEGYPGVPDLDSIEGRVVSSSVAHIGQFECSNELINQIHQMVHWTEISNLHSIPTDCPQRDERQGWLNDLGARSEEMVYNFDMTRFLPKFIADIEDAQDPTTGAITDTVPYRWGSRPADPVSVSYLLMPWWLYLHQGDTHIIQDHYNGYKGWVDYLTSRAKDHIVDYSYYGDWSPPKNESLSGSRGDSAVSMNTPGTLMSTGYYYYSASLLSRFARILRRQDDENTYAVLASQIGKAYHQRFWNEAMGGYGSNNQACNAFSLFLGLVPSEIQASVIANLVKDVDQHNGHLTTGNLCTKYLLDVLTEAGRADVAYTIATQETYPSWGYMLSNGATTLWERWEQMTGGGMNSHNHPMMGSIGAWFYKALAGITIDPAGPAYGLIHIRPQIVGDLTFVRSNLDTVRGQVSVMWERNPEGLKLELVIPVTSKAEVSLPIDSENEEINLFEGDVQLWHGSTSVGQVEGITNLMIKDQTLHLSIGSGKYSFRLQYM